MFLKRVISIDRVFIKKMNQLCQLVLEDSENDIKILLDLIDEIPEGFLPVGYRIYFKIKYQPHSDNFVVSIQCVIHGNEKRVSFRYKNNLGMSYFIFERFKYRDNWEDEVDEICKSKSSVVKKVIY